ncbi:MAG: hypothetical protein JSW43_07335 [Gemmatimonadota bacterium]|nr:MAG: hypothetical protein JSW43_07335 [Gemmatimonadota bacterium]
MMQDKSLSPSIWCGIVAVAVGAAAAFVNVYLGVAVLAVGGTWFARSCYKDYRSAER